MDRIGFIITTFERPFLLQKSLLSLLQFKQDNWEIIVIDQSKNEIKLENCNYYKAPFDSGLSFCRNLGIQRANELHCNYCVMSSDAFLFNNTIKELDNIILELKRIGYDKCGFELYPGCKCQWEANMQLIKGEFIELDFIDKSKIGLLGTKYPMWIVDICRNFYVATIESLLATPYNNELKLAEHELQALEYKEKGFKTVWTNAIVAEKMTDRPNEYFYLRQKNWNEGLEKLKQILGIKRWVNYKNLERAKY